VLAVVGGFVLRDAIKSRHEDTSKTGHRTPRLAKWIQSIHIPGTMMSFKAIGGKKVSLVFIAPMGFATGLLAASIAVGGFIGVPAMIYALGVPAIMATATELVVAFVMGAGGSLFYAWEGFVDIRMAMIILAGSLFGVQIGAIGTTYVKEATVKFVMGMIMIIVLFSRLLQLPVYLSDLSLIDPIGELFRSILNYSSFATLAFALVAGAVAILYSLLQGMALHKKQHEILSDVAATD